MLDGIADRESRSGAWTWRFSSASIRRGFDAGATAEGLLTALREASFEGRVPQPLEYLIGDVARRHGTVRVRPAASCLRCDDPALMSEILRTKALAKLKLAAVSETVLTSASPVAATLAALRAAGYTPAGENADGTPLLERTPRQRAVSAQQPTSVMAGTGLPASITFDQLPAELLDELAENFGDDVPQGLLESLLSRPGTPPALSDPAELARKLLTMGTTTRANGSGRSGRSGRHPRTR
jgi:hypothetical protein